MFRPSFSPGSELAIWRVAPDEAVPFVGQAIIFHRVVGISWHVQRTADRSSYVQREAQSHRVEYPLRRVELVLIRLGTDPEHGRLDHNFFPFIVSAHWCRLRQAAHAISSMDSTLHSISRTPSAVTWRIT